MLNRFTTATVAVLVLAFAAAFSAQAQSLKFYGDIPADPLTASLLAKEQALMTAILHRDFAGFSSNLTTDFVFVNYNGHRDPRGEFFGEGALKEFSIYEPQALSLDDGVVLFSYNAIVGQIATDDEEHIPRYQHVTTIWVKQGTDWKEKFHQSAALQVGS